MWNKHINLLNVLCSGLLAKSRKCLFPVSCSLVKHFYRFTKQPEWASAGGGVSTKESCSALLVCSRSVRIHSHREKTSLHFIWTQILSNVPSDQFGSFLLRTQIFPSQINLFHSPTVDSFTENLNVKKVVTPSCSSPTSWMFAKTEVRQHHWDKPHTGNNLMSLLWEGGILSTHSQSSFYVVY